MRVGSEWKWWVRRDWRSSGGGSHRPPAFFWRFTRSGASVGTETEFVCLFCKAGFTIYITPVSLHCVRLHWGHTGSQARLRTRTRGNYGAVCVNGLRWERTGGQRTSKPLCRINNTYSTARQQHAVRGIRSGASHTNRRGRGRRGGLFMGYLLDFHHPVVLNLCSGWGRSRSCWKPPGPGMWLWWRNCWVERKEYWGQAPVPSHYPTY